MPTIELAIGQQIHKVSCGEGEEERLEHLGDKINARIATLSKSFGRVSDTLLMLVTALTMEDEIERLKGKLSNNNVASIPANKEEDIAAALDLVAEKIENLAQSCLKESA